jgi:hypothetical protein
MTTHIPSQVLAFAGGEANLGIYKKFVDLYRHYEALNGKKNVEFATKALNANGVMVDISYAEKEEQMNALLKREILRVAGIATFSDFPIETWASHPTLQWASFAVVSALVDMILPESLIDSIGMYTEVKNIGWGDSAAFDITPRDLFVVSKVGRSKRTTELKKQFRGQVVVVPELRAVTVFVSLHKVLAGKESLAEFVAKCVRSMEVQMTVDAYNAFVVALGAVSATASTGLRVSGYTQAEFVRLAQTVTAWNQGAQAIAIGTKLALSNILPADGNYRYTLESDYAKLGYIRNFNGVDIMELPQVADWANPYGLLLDNAKIWFVSPSSQKLLKVVIEGNTLSHTDDVFENANLTQTSTLYKSFGVAVATNAVAAQMSL